MVKYILIILAFISPLYASQAPLSSNLSSPEEHFTENLTEPTNTPNQIALIINHLEHAIALLDEPNSSLIQENMTSIETLARPLVVKFVALIKINKLAECGIERAQVFKLLRTYGLFKTKLKNVASDTEISTEPKHAQSLT